MLRVALCQMNPTVGDIPGNQKKILAGLERARAVGAHLVVFPEMALTGCPLEELGRLPDFMAAVQRALAELAPATQGLSAVVGTPLWDGGLRNGAVVFHDGAPVGPVEKRLVLPGSPGAKPGSFCPGRVLASSGTFLFPLVWSWGRISPSFLRRLAGRRIPSRSRQLSSRV